MHISTFGKKQIISEFQRGLKFAIFAIIHYVSAQTTLKLELVPIISVIRLRTETIRKAGKPTANMVTVTMMQAPIGKSANGLASKHVIARYATKGGTKRAMNASAIKGGKSQIIADVVTTWRCLVGDS